MTIAPFISRSHFYRYLWYCIHLAALFTYRPVLLPENPTYIAEEDVTIIDAARSWLVGKPKEILIITEEKMLGPLQDLANAPCFRWLTGLLPFLLLSLFSPLAMTFTLTVKLVAPASTFLSNSIRKWTVVV
ncbi:hypothetical protein BT96DRAFT_1069981 [Gymnopus androsaceus JB14]|uniref:Uncharacterized protein n=1 Tax=Gymnopus androsaceus JB14 TaxID=1447944 RepID=A0A6A4GW08_9AGAR|nr:hypothetical protein BT96DRAFT_1069981 [Gymnopus androsaceus JB14]